MQKLIYSHSGTGVIGTRNIVFQDSSWTHLWMIVIGGLSTGPKALAQWMAVGIGIGMVGAGILFGLGTMTFASSVALRRFL